MPDETTNKLHKLELIVTQVKTEVKGMSSKLDDLQEVIKELAIVAKQQVQLSAEVSGLKDYQRKVDALFKKLDVMQDKILTLTADVRELKIFKANVENRTWDIVKPLIIAVITGIIGFVVGHGKF